MHRPMRSERFNMAETRSNFPGICRTFKTDAHTKVVRQSYQTRNIIPPARCVEPRWTSAIARIFALDVFQSAIPPMSGRWNRRGFLHRHETVGTQAGARLDQHDGFSPAPWRRSTNSMETCLGNDVTASAKAL